MDITGQALRIEPSTENGLQKVSFVMTDKIVTVDKNMIGKRVEVLFTVRMPI